MWMKRNEFNRLEEWFSGFIRGFDTSNELIQTNLRYKEVHSFEVAKNCHLVADSLNQPEENLILAEAIGLLHDAGRFPQFFHYQTFQDSQSENHACLGVRVLEEQCVLDLLKQEDKNILIQAIRCHNLFKLPVQSEMEGLFSKIIRDSDKLDIFRFIRESEKNRLYGNPGNTIHLELDSHPSYSDSMMDAILNNQCCYYSDLKTVHDFKLLQLSWIFDVNFPITFQKIIEKEYLTELFDQLPTTKKVAKLIKKINQFVNSKLNLQTFQETSEE